MTGLRKFVSILLVTLFVSQSAFSQASGMQGTQQKEDATRILLNLKIELLNLQQQLEDSKKQKENLEAQITELQKQIELSQKNSSSLTSISEEQNSLISQQYQNLEDLGNQLREQMLLAEDLQNTYNSLNKSIKTMETEMKVYRTTAVITVGVGIGLLASFFLINRK